MKPRVSESLSRKPIVLYHAAAERRQAGRAAYERRDYVLAAYLAGLSVECILQAIALRHDPTHDARHDLAMWLARCGLTLQRAVKTPPAVGRWNLLVRVWRNELRYLSRSGFLGYVRGLGLHMGISGGTEAIMKQNAKCLLEAAAAVHNAGVIEWDRSTGRS